MTKSKIYIFYGLIFACNSTSIVSMPPKLNNCGNTCFLNASLQAFLNIEPFTNLFISVNPYSKTASPAPYYFAQIAQKVALDLNTTLEFTCNTGNPLFEFLAPAYRLLDAPTCTQQDAHEFITQFLDAIRTGLSNENQQKIYSLFGIQLASGIGCPKTEERPIESIEEGSIKLPLSQELHLELEVQTPETSEMPSEKLDSLEKCLKNYFKAEILDEYVDSRGVKHTRKADPCYKQFMMATTPPYLLMSLKRFKYTEEGTVKKLTHNISIPEYLNVENFTQAGSQYPRQHQYRLIAVVVHIGASPKAGHYIAYVNFKNQWYQCDDRVITQVQITDPTHKKNIEGDSDATGYFFVYKKTPQALQLAGQNIPSHFESNLVPALNTLSQNLSDLARALQTR